VCRDKGSLKKGLTVTTGRDNLLEEKASTESLVIRCFVLVAKEKESMAKKKANTAMMLSWEIVVSGLKDSTAKVASVEISCEKQCATITCPTQAPMASESRNSVDDSVPD